MPDQFSLEYIAYILSDEAEGLQDAMGWAKKGGWVSINGKPELVTEVDDYAATYKAKGIWRGQGELPKLPVLHDLLQIIEGALRPHCGYMFSFNEYEGDEGQRNYRCYEVTPLEYMEPLGNEPHDDLMLAAAKLAVRVLTNRDYTNHA